jgi:ubiquinone/menaquinone biosynthesis C-methylase UbiE
MPGSRRSDNPSTYFVQDRKNGKELTRLMIQDRLLTAGMGGVLAEQPDPTIFRRVLDVGCGTGGWLVEAAQAYPEMSLVGIDISHRMIKYARAHAEAHHVDGRVEFHVMDALQEIELPVAFFDLVNLRLGMSFLRTWDWPKMLGALLRVTRPGGVVRITESEFVSQNDSPALTRLTQMGLSAFYRAGHLFTEETAGVTRHLASLLDQLGCEHVQTKDHIMDYWIGTVEGEVYCEDMMLLFQSLRPFIQKWGNLSRDYEAVYRQALEEMRQPDFHATWNMLTAWGNKPRLKSQEPQQ